MRPPAPRLRTSDASSQHPTGQAMSALHRQRPSPERQRRAVRRENAQNLAVAYCLTLRRHSEIIAPPHALPAILRRRGCSPPFIQQISRARMELEQTDRKWRGMSPVGICRRQPLSEIPATRPGAPPPAAPRPGLRHPRRRGAPQRPAAAQIRGVRRLRPRRPPERPHTACPACGDNLSPAT